MNYQENRQRDKYSGISGQKLDDLQDLEPIELKHYKTAEPTRKSANDFIHLNLGPFTSKAILLLVCGLVIWAMTIPWVEVRLLLEGITIDTVSVVQYKDNLYSILIVGAAIVCVLLYLWLDEKKWLFISMFFFVDSAFFMAGQLSRVKKAWTDMQLGMSNMFRIEYTFQPGFYLYGVSAFLMLFAGLLVFMDRNNY